MSFVPRPNLDVTAASIKTATDRCTTWNRNSNVTPTADLSSLTIDTMESIIDDNDVIIEIGGSKSLLRSIAVHDDVRHQSDRCSNHDSNQLQSSRSNASSFYDRDIFRRQKPTGSPSVADEDDKISVTNNQVAMHCSNSLFPAVELQLLSSPSSSAPTNNSHCNCMEYLSAPPIGASSSSEALDMVRESAAIDELPTVEMPQPTGMDGATPNIDSNRRLRSYDSEIDDDGDYDALLNSLFNDNKDYVDFQPQMPQHNVPYHRSFLRDETHFLRHQQQQQQQPKLRSLSESEVRDSVHWDIPASSKSRSSANILRYRNLSGNQYNADSFPARADVRNRAYTADTTTAITTPTTDRIRRRTVSYNYNKEDHEKSFWSSNFSNDEIYHHPQSFHSSWDDADNRLMLPTSTCTTHRIESKCSSEAFNDLVPSYRCNSSLEKSRRMSTSSIGTNCTGDSLSLSNQSGHQDRDSWSSTIVLQQPQVNTMPTTNSTNNNTGSTNEIDQERLARMRWLRINRRFQYVVAVVVLIFSIVLFAILICWIVLTSTFILAWNKPCDVELKPYFWCATLQLLFDIFRTDILRIVFRWNRQSNEPIPGRVIVYNIIYFIYAVLVLRWGIKSVITPTETCSTTAPEFFHASVAFVSLSLAAWATIIFGYVLPFCVVAVLLTINGFNPNTSVTNSSTASNTSPFPFIPSAYATSGAPLGCVDKLHVVELNDLSGNSYPKECCICMEPFNDQDLIVATMCRHVFHKNCCREWLRQARTCPVCRDDIPSRIEQQVSVTFHRQQFGLRSCNDIQCQARQATSNGGYQQQRQREASIPIGPSDRPVASLIRVFCDARNQFTDGHATSTDTPINNDNTVTASGGSTITNTSDIAIGDIERGY